MNLSGKFELLNVNCWSSAACTSVYDAVYTVADRSFSCTQFDGGRGGVGEFDGGKAGVR